jgi:uncharacterized protein (DUF924 family)
MNEIEQILDFWFGVDFDPSAPPADDRQRLWFGKDSATDQLIRTRFGDGVEAAARGALDGWASHPRGRLALIVLLDQFTRNIHRDNPEAFACDAKALTLCLEGLTRDHDRALAPLQRVFFYLPMEHAEDLALQERCVAAFETLRAEAPAASEKAFDGFLDYARRHRDIIGRFGRFPHRNAVLGRISTQAETDFLAQPGSSF